VAGTPTPATTSAAMIERRAIGCPLRSLTPVQHLIGGTGYAFRAHDRG
jgi:hypothetical protein